MIPAYNKLAENLKGLVDIASLDCTDSANAAICAKYRVEGYPTLKFFIVNDSGAGKRKKTVLDYDGGRDTAEMTKYIKLRMHQFIFKVSEKVSKSAAEKSASAAKWNINFDTFFSKVQWFIFIYFYSYIYKKYTFTK